MSVLRWIFTGLSRTSVWVWFSRRILSKWTLRIMGYPETALKRYADIVSIVMNRDKYDVLAFCTCDRKTPVAMLIKMITGDRFSHAGIIVNPTTVYDSRSGGVAFRNLLETVAQADDFAIVKFRLKGKEMAADYRRDIERYLGRDYDFTQELGGKSLYCSELIYMLLRGRVEEEVQARFFHGQRGFSPGDVYNSGTVVFDHNPTGVKK